jgi:hypothetical protein
MRPTQQSMINERQERLEQEWARVRHERKATICCFSYMARQTDQGEARNRMPMGGRFE